jgi:dUTP diphosphatase
MHSIARMEILIRRLDPGLVPPSRAYQGDAGLDLSAREAVKLEPGERASVPTGIAVAIPEGHAGLVVPRSGLAARHGISIVNGPGLIDAGYRGEVQVMLVNLGEEVFTAERGDRIAQLVVVPVVAAPYREVEQLPESPRGPDGFGSSGT